MVQQPSRNQDDPTYAVLGWRSVNPLNSISASSVTRVTGRDLLKVDSAL